MLLGSQWLASLPQHPLLPFSRLCFLYLSKAVKEAHEFGGRKLLTGVWGRVNSRLPPQFSFRQLASTLWVFWIWQTQKMVGTGESWVW